MRNSVNSKNHIKNKIKATEKKASHPKDRLSPWDAILRKLSARPGPDKLNFHCADLRPKAKRDHLSQGRGALGYQEHHAQSKGVSRKK